ncbi:hypothetical protein [Mycolicibacterium vanbaalenii]|uniref:hypothetical protein n=1 Tax=Mycolicibacterium vanbaalenii TaxID=110539 RepID=UPI0021F31C57|nr:hypothetical protein [Mycolicibacterium vanbaalenii]
MPTDELRDLAESLHRLEAAAAAADWDDDAALSRAEAQARVQLAATSAGADIAAARDPGWLALAQNRGSAAALLDRAPSSPEQARANAVVALGLARTAVAEAVLAVAAARRATSEATGTPTRPARYTAGSGDWAASPGPSPPRSVTCWPTGRVRSSHVW